MLRRIASLALVATAAFALSGCFVTSQNLPAGFGDAGDPRLAGTWRGIDGHDGKDVDTYAHVLQHAGKPMSLVWVENKDHRDYELRTAVIGNRNVFAAKVLGPQEALTDDRSPGWILGFYEYDGPSGIKLWLLSSSAIEELIKKGLVKGTSSGPLGTATLSGSPEEVAAFLASPEAYGARMREAAKLRRLTQYQ